MSTSNGCSSFAARHAVRIGIAVLGVAAIVGSGGGGFPEMDFGVPPSPPKVSVIPSRITVQVGATVQFKASSSATTYQWQRDGVKIPGANSQTYTLVGVNLGDDGAHFSVVVSNENGTSTASGLLQVSPLPGVVYEDDDFQMSNWKVTAATQPTQVDTKLSATRSETGASGAYLSVSYELPAGPESSILIFHTYLAATYDPAQQGAIYVIDITASCHVLVGEPSVRLNVPLEQAGRRFKSRQGGSCAGWNWPFSVPSISAGNFDQVDGPACGAAEVCPDFSGQGAPIRFGLLTSDSHTAATPAKAVTYGIDNWKVTVWRK
jgi:hypothetical protein